MRTTRLAFLLTAIAMLLAMPTAAFAYAPTGDDFITCVAGGDTVVECEAGEYDPDSSVAWTAEYNPEIANGTATADADGTASFSFDAADVPDGSEITVTTTGTFDGETKVLSDVIATAADGEIIANAGAESLTIISLAAGALLLGVGILAVNRRRSATNA